MLSVEEIQNISINNLQCILRQKFEIIHRANVSEVMIAQSDIDMLYEYFVENNKIMSNKEFRNHLICAQVASKR